jgi:hypothetical protein
MSVACQKNFVINIGLAGPCQTPTVKNWTTTFVTGRTFDTSLEGLTVGMLLQPASSKVWLFPIQHAATFFFDTYSIITPGPVSPSNIYANPDGGFPSVATFIYVAALNKFVVWRQRFNGATYDLWLTFVDGTTGVESSAITGLSTEFTNSQFALVDRTGLSHSYVAFLNGNVGTHLKVFLIDVNTESIVLTKDLGATIGNAICYSCKTDSFFVQQGNDLIELDRATLNIKHTYVNQAVNTGALDYIKTTEEVWGITSSNTPVDITNVNTGAHSTMNLTNQFSGWANGFPGSRFYHESLNAFCVPGTTPGFSGNPWYYDIYDVTTRTLKKQIDLSTQFQAFCSADWWAQCFNLTLGSIYLAAGCVQTPPNYGVIEIGTS